jgi:hypothetical protein
LAFQTLYVHYGRLIAKSNINIKTTWNIVKKTRKVLSAEHMPSLHINNKKQRIQETWLMPSIISF